MLWRQNVSAPKRSGAKMSAPKCRRQNVLAPKCLGAKTTGIKMSQRQKAAPKQRRQNVGAKPSSSPLQTSNLMIYLRGFHICERIRACRSNSPQTAVVRTQQHLSVHAPAFNTDITVTSTWVTENRKKNTSKGTVGHKRHLSVNDAIIFFHPL